MAETASPANLKELIARQGWEELRARLKQMHYSDIAEMLATLPVAERAIVFRLLDRDHASEVFGYLPPGEQSELIHSLSDAEVKLVLDLMRPDDKGRPAESPEGRWFCSKHFKRLGGDRYLLIGGDADERS